MVTSRTQLEALPEGERLPALEALGACLTSRVLDAPDFDAEVKNIVAEMRAEGHDLFLYASDGSWQLWCGDWTKHGGTKLVLHFDPAAGVEASWSQS
jgi:hypothetical protein